MIAQRMGVEHADRLVRFAGNGMEIAFSKPAFWVARLKAGMVSLSFTIIPQ